MQTYKWFNDKETIGLDPDLIWRLDRARELAGIPFVITSGFRNKEQNAAVGGVVDSAHLTGRAVDLRCNDSNDRLRIIAALIWAGFIRIGIGQGHIHVDIDEEKPQEVLFLEYA